MVEDRGRMIPTIGGMLLFGKTPNRFLPQAGITLVAYPGTEKDDAAIERPPPLQGPMTPLRSARGLVEPGPVEEAISFVHRNRFIVRLWREAKAG